jgi:hypothetical protein
MNQKTLQRLVVTIALAFVLLPCLATAQQGRPAGPHHHSLSSTISGGEENGGLGGVWDFFASLFRAEDGESASPRGSRKSLLDLLDPWCPNPFDNRGTIDPDGNP